MKSALAFFLMVSVTLLARGAETSIAASPPMTLDEAVRLAYANNNDIQKAIEYKNWARGKYIEERAGAFPQMGLVIGSSEQKDDFTAELADQSDSFENRIDYGQLSLQQPLFTWGQIGAAVRAAKEGMAMTDELIRQSEQTVRHQVTEAFCDILLAQELLILANHNLAQKERHFEESNKKFSVGTSTEYDVLAAQVAVENSRPEVIRAENAVRLAKDRLSFLIGIDRINEIAGSLDSELIQIPSYAEAVEIARANRPELANAKHQIAIYKELIKISRAANKPRVDLRAKYGWSWYTQNDLEADGSAWSAGVSISFPFFDGFRTFGRVKQARYDLTSSEIDQAKLEDAIALEIRDAVGSLNESSQIVQALQETAWQAERLLMMSEKGYELGVKTRLDVEDAELNLIAAKSNLMRAKRDYIVAKSNLTRSTGYEDTQTP